MLTTDEFDQHRSTLFGLAYRMLGSVMDAEDILQEAFLRWQNVPESEVRSPKAYLMTIVTRLSVDQLRRAHVQREEYVGAWLPEPLLQSSESDPARLVELDESISTAFLVLLESPSPLDRAVFLLHEVFNYTFAEIAAIVDRTPADCRQIGHRARQRLMKGRPRFAVKTESVNEIVQQFLRACVGDDMAELLALLAPDVTVTNDSGGKVSAVRNMLVGANTTARLFLGLFRRRVPGLTFHIVAVNGQPALIVCVDGQPVSVINFDVRDSKIHAIYTVRVSSRSPRSPKARPDVEWAQASLETGEGLAEAVAGVAVIIHCATSPSKLKEVDVEGTRRLLELSRPHGVKHFMYISIIGVDKIPYKLFQAKYEAEQIIKESGVPYTILRAPQFYQLFEMVLKAFTKPPIGLVPKGFRHQPMDANEVAEHMVDLVKAGPSGHVADIAGPCTYEFIDLARTFLKAQGKRKPLLQIPFFGKFGAAMRAGYATAPDKARDGLTWEDWLQKHYG